MKADEILVKRIYEPASKTDGARILVDRLWPRGVSKVEAALDAWLKDIAPSTELRDWFHHDDALWSEFRKRYFAELDKNLDAVAELREWAKKGRVSLLYAAHDEAHNNAVALREYLLR
ncbi:MAG: DUF488 domain-containing protein [Xanthomonadaceae bacterium]|nr:DUF488 domain-containing protein [Xanthomonadaceae bacterium]